MRRTRKEMKKEQLKSIALMFLVISVMYSIALINEEGIESFIQEISTGTNNLANLLLRPSITGFATIFANSPPYFDPSPPDYNLTEDQLFEVQLNATDPDNDTITFTDNSGSPEAYWAVFDMNGTGFISFTPTNDDVGNHTIGISIEDGINDPVTENIVFSVANVNDPPEILNYTPTSLTPETTENNSIGFSFEYNATDPDIPYGDVLTARWIVDGVVNSTTINETSGSWNLTTGFCEPSHRNITLEVSDIENETDSITWDLSITNVNREPVWNAIINNITWEEDNELTNNISLDDYFYDLDYSECGDNPSFSSTGSTNITITIGSATPHYVSFCPDSNWFGSEEIYFTINDGYATADSNNLTLNVTNVQDPPEIESIPDQEAYAYVLFSYQVIASDPDNDTLTYYDNITLFNISSATGLINFTPTADNIGNYTINIIAGDGTDNASTLMNLSILNNTAPVIDSINNQIATEGTAFSLTVTGSDADGDSLTFSSNYSKMLNPVSSNTTAANFSFTPADEDNGNHTILVIVNDTRGATDSTTFVLQVVDVNNPPELDLIGDRIAKINKTFSLQVNASDPDSGDNLTFSDNTSLFNITWLTPLTGLIEFTPGDSDEGNHSVNISVTDDAPNPETDYEVVIFEVTPNRAPVIDSIGNQTATEDLEFNLTINASDPDEDTLTFSDNTSLFDINPSTGIISFTPNASHVGVYQIQINATDDDNATDSANFWLNI
ncbi:tandem-95 repeat protein, partial [Patescibacteria group bacterium]|nr:tandem-95 repeat protein [Patescibacteria group bacterium]